RTLQDELGIEPEPATLALYEELKRSAAPVLPRPATPARAALPLPPTRLIDRERELGELAALLAAPTNRLITITGPGGVGKTRLALHVATANAPAFADGVCFVPLAPIREPAQVLIAIAQALGVPQNDARPLEQLVAAALAQRQLLLLLDNCEHLLPAAATLVAPLLAAAPLVVVLATSRVTLRLTPERRYALAPLSLESDDQTADVHSVQSAAVALFVERAQAARPAVELDYAAMGAICRRLDGLPLAIELAATRARLLNPHKLLARLEQRLPLLSSSLRDVPERQQTLHATIDWSYQLLDPYQQALFRRLAVFAGGWTVAAAEAVCADLSHPATGVLDALSALLDASLISEMTGTGEPRCTMLETIREYAHEQLAAQGELARAQELHAGYVVALGAQAALELSGANQLEWLQRCDDELDNLRTVLSWCSAHAVGAGLRLASDLSRFWDVRGYRREGRDWLETLLDHARQPNDPAPAIEERAAGLLVAGMLAMYLSDFDPATRRLRESLGLYHQLEDQQNIARVLNNLGNVALQQGAYPQAERYYRESLALRRELNHTMGMAASLNNLAITTRLQGDPQAAKAYYDQSLTLYQQAGDRVAAASVMGHIATILLNQGEYSQAQQLYEASHAIAQELGHKPGLRHTLAGLGHVARSQLRYSEAKQYFRQSLRLSVEIQHIKAVAGDLVCFATIAWAEQRVERAAVLLSAAAALNHSAQTAQPPEGIVEFEEHLALVRAALDAASFDGAWARGQGLSLDQAAALAIDE
ncbi:MAG: tetratricopeptide repeat protein, partial [Chloroflexales bacterium]|nr:tetratricopeptide repeat protein [Chloroflexales bacterium]